MKENKKFKRQCYACRQYKDKEDLIRLTRDYREGDIKINNKNEIMGRSIYICKNIDCINKFIKNKKSLKSLNTQMNDAIKNMLGTVLKN